MKHTNVEAYLLAGILFVIKVVKFIMRILDSCKCEKDFFAALLKRTPYSAGE